MTTEDGRGRGFGFVSFEDHEAAAKVSCLMIVKVSVSLLHEVFGLLSNPRSCCQMFSFSSLLFSLKFCSLLFFAVYILFRVGCGRVEW